MTLERLFTWCDYDFIKKKRHKENMDVADTINDSVYS